MIKTVFGAGGAELDAGDKDDRSSELMGCNGLSLNVYVPIKQGLLLNTDLNGFGSREKL